MLELTQEQLMAYLREELHLGKVSSMSEPDGIFYSEEEKRHVLERFYENRNRTE